MAISNIITARNPLSFFLSLILVRTLSDAYKAQLTTIGDILQLKFDPNDPTMKSGSFPTYSLSKCGLNAFSSLLAKQLQDEGFPDILVYAADPGMPFSLSFLRRSLILSSGWCRTDMGGAGASRSPEQGFSIFIYLSVAYRMYRRRFNNVLC